MPYRVELSLDDDIKALMQRAVQIPIIKFQSSDSLSQLADAHLHALKYSVLNIFHSISHGHLELEDFRLSSPFK